MSLPAETAPVVLLCLALELRLVRLFYLPETKDPLSVCTPIAWSSLQIHI